MKNYFGFIDETGVLHHDLDQRFFAIGLLKCEDTSVLYEELQALKNRAESKLDYERHLRGLSSKKGSFEFKFSAITKGAHEFYYELIDLYFKFSKLQFSSLVIDKNNPDELYSDTWEAYINYSKALIKNNLKDTESICIIADFLGKPKANNNYYVPEMRTISGVYNATMLESHASLFIQLVDVLVGCVVFDFRRTRQSDKKYDLFKVKVCDFLKKKLGVETLAESMTNLEPGYFKVQELKVKK